MIDYNHTHYSYYEIEVYNPVLKGWNATGNSAFQDVDTAVKVINRLKEKNPGKSYRLMLVEHTEVKL
jgi:hypothetical protein